jgi:hypothetical protein
MSQRIPSPQDFLRTVRGPQRRTSANRPIRLAVVDPAYDPFTSWPNVAPPARVTFEGETTLTGKAYPIADGFIPRAGQRVWLQPIGNSYLISGSIGGGQSQGFWQEPDGSVAGVELGDGSYFDTTEGLVLAQDAAISGTLTHGPRDLRVPEVQRGHASVTGAVAAINQSLAVTYPVAWPAGIVPVVITNITSSSSSLPFITSRPVNVTNVGFTLAIVKSDAAQANFTLSALPVDWIAFATP